MRTLAEFTKTPLIGGVLTSSWHLHFSPIFDPSSPKTAEIHRFPSATAAKAERAADRSPKITPVKGRREGGSTFIDRDCPFGYGGGYTAITDFLRTVRPPATLPFEVRFETPPGRQAQADFAQFQVVFTDEPAVTRIVWLFSLVQGFSRWLWARFVLHQDLQTVLRCHIAAFADLGGVPEEILYDRMKTAVIGEAAEGGIVYNRTLLDFAGHYRFHPRACRPYRAKTKGKVERPFRYIRQDFFLGRTFRNLDDLNAQLADWLATVANVRVHATTRRVVAEAFAEER